MDPRRGIPGGIMTRSEAQDTKDGRPWNLGAGAVWTPDAPEADAGERAEDLQPHLAAYLGASDREALRARVKPSTTGRLTLVTVEPRLRDGDVIHVDGAGGRKAHRISGMRHGLRSRDPQDLRIAQLSAIPD